MTVISRQRLLCYLTVVVLCLGSGPFAAVGLGEDAGSIPAADRALLAEGRRAVDRWNAPRAREAAKQLMQRYPQSPFVYKVAARADFISGRYAECRKKLKKIRELGGEPPENLAKIIGELKELHKSFKTIESGRFAISYARSIDGVITDYAFPVLKRSLISLSKHLDWKPGRAKIRVEIYPDVKSFSTATTLSMKEIKTSGAVAICKFNRIMITSPRLYLRGYRWADTLAHELTHYVLIRKTGHDIPVWLHEGIAKYSETLWRQGGASNQLTPMQSTLLAEARKTDQFIPFEDMAISLVKLDSSHEVALAYAEVVSFIHYLNAEHGVESLGELIGRIESGKTVGSALSEVAGGSTDKMFGRWKNWLNDVSLDPIPGLRVLPRKLTEKRDNTAREERMSGSVPEDAQKYIRLGDMLRDAQRPGGAVKEYRKALQRSDKISPDLRVELARVLMRSDQITPAETTLSEVGKYYPDYLPLYLTRARIHRQQGATEATVEDLRTVIDINPFDPRPHRMLIRIYREKDEEGKLQREQKVLKEIYNWLRE